MQSIRIVFNRQGGDSITVSEFRLECANLLNLRKLNTNIFGYERWLTYTPDQAVYQMKLSYIYFPISNPAIEKNKLTTLFDNNQIETMYHILNYQDFLTYPYPVYGYDWKTGNYRTVEIAFFNVSIINGGADFKSTKADGDGQRITITFQANIIAQPNFIL